MASKRESSSSDESSDDEEEQLRISQAVLGVGDSLFGSQKSDGKSHKPADATSSLSDTKSSGIKKGSVMTRDGIDVSTLKSNRRQDKNEENDNPLLQTTPEFRAYVAKQLSKLLDRQLSEYLSEKSWKLKISENWQKSQGLKLFSNSEPLCEVLSADAVMKSNQKSTQVAKKRKIRLSTSSESSEDDDIKSCVFTVSDIAHENEILASLESKKDKAKETSSAGHNGSLTKLDREDGEQVKNKQDDTKKEPLINLEEGERVKKKKKKKKTSNSTNDNKVELS